MYRVVKARSCIEDRPPAARGVIGREFSVCNAICDDPGNLPHEMINMRFDHIPQFGDQCDVGRKQLRVVQRPSAPGRNQEIEPASQAFRSRTVNRHQFG